MRRGGTRIAGAFALWIGACAVDPGGIPPLADGAVGCRSDAECDDAIECTIDRCSDGLCTTVADDSMCSEGQVCSVDLFGCTAAGFCDEAECAVSLGSVAECLVGVCVAPDNRCVQESACDAAAPSCCGDGTCADCDDDNPCTDDLCTGRDASGGAICEHVSREGAPCDDGVFCNGVDTCTAGACAHAGDPCVGDSECVEARGVCVGCTVDSDCPDDQTPSFPACPYADVCAQTATRSRTIVSFACRDDVCERTERVETDDCSRSTNGDVCASPSGGAWRDCGGFAEPCGQSGTEVRTVTYHRCAGGTCGANTCEGTACTGVGLSGSRPCSRDTGGRSCGADVLGTWSACGGFMGACDDTGTRTRSVTPRVCAGGSCGNGMSSTETENCSRETNGDACGTPMTTHGPCSYANDQDCSGSRVATTTSPFCSGGTCGGSMTETMTEPGGQCAVERANHICGAAVVVNSGTCQSTGSGCSTSGERVITKRNRRCDGSGGCSPSGPTFTEMEPCTFDPAGRTCGDGACSGTCRTNGTCNTSGSDGLSCTGPGSPCVLYECDAGVCALDGPLCRATGCGCPVGQVCGCVESGGTASCQCS